MGIYLKLLGPLFISLLLFTGFAIAQQQAIKPEIKNAPWKLLSAEDSLKLKVESFLRNSKPVMGYRFVVTGDFDGDHRTDTLFERYTDSALVKEAPKYYDSPDTNFGYWDVVFLSGYLYNRSFIEWKKYNCTVGGGQIGFHYVENCGDINLDGKDELLVVKQWPDASNLNHAYIYTFRNGDWEEIYFIPLWEWQFPPTPSASMIPGMFGNFQYGVTQNDSADRVLEKAMKEFKYIHHYPDQSVEFSGRNPIWENYSAKEREEYDKIGDQAYLKKHFKKVYINDSLYLQDRKNHSLNYKAMEIDTQEEGNMIVFPLDDAADMVTTRIYINHPQSPFRKKQSKHTDTN